MHQVFFCMEMPDEKGYFGGIATIIRDYLSAHDQFEEKGYSVHLLSCTRDSVKWIKNSKLQNIAYAIKQKKYVQKNIHNTDILHIHTSKDWLLLKDSYLIHYIKRKVGCKIVLTIHFADFQNIFYQNTFLQKLQFRGILEADRLILLSEKTKQEFESRGFPPEKIKVAYTFHNMDIEKMPQKSKKVVRLLFVGSLDNRKGIIDLLEILNELKYEDFYLDICGKVMDPNMREIIQDLVEPIKRKITMHGYVSGQKKQGLFEVADVLVLPSYGEGMPIVVMEALAAGCAVLSTKVGAIPEIISEENGILINPGDKKALKEGLLRFIKDREKLATCQSNNYEKGNDYSRKTHIDQLIDIYEGVNT